MSKIVVLQASLEGSTTVNSAFDRVKAQNPVMADFIASLDILPIIRECMESAIDRVCEIEGYSRAEKVRGFYEGEQFKSDKMIGVIKSDRFSRGVGITLADNGKIEFVADEYGHRSEVNMIQAVFTDAFIAEATKASLTILNYDVAVTTQREKDGKVSFLVEGVLS